MTFEEVKEMFKKSIDTTDTMNQAIENLIQSIYLKGYNDALNTVEVEQEPKSLPSVNPQEPCDDFLSREERFKMLMETGKFDFLKDIPSDTIWKLVFALGFIQNEDTCSDAISRQAVHDAMYELCGEGSLKDNPWRDNPHIDAITDAIDSLPPVTPQQKTGHWNCGDDMFEYAICSSCKHETGEAWEYAKRNFKYCPNCGCRMIETQEGSDEE